MEPRPSLAESIAVSLKPRAKRVGLLAYIPYIFIGCVAAGAAAGWFLPDDFWKDDKWDVSTAVYGGLLAFNGLMLALGWFAFAKMYEIISTGPMADALRRHGLLGVHLSFIDLSHFFLIFSACASGFGLVTVLIGLPVWADRIVFALAIAGTTYSLVKAVDATRTVSALVWEQAHMQKPGPHLREVKADADA